MTEKIDVVDALAGLAEDLRSQGNFVDRLSDAVAAMKKERDAALAEVERLRGLKAELPPRPGNTDDTIVNLPRYGIRWNGPTEPISVPMDDGYWTPWHIAQAQIQQAIDAFHDASRLRSLIQQARIKAEDERDEARAEVDRLRGALALSEVDVALERTWCRICRTENRSDARSRDAHPHEVRCPLARKDKP